MKSVNWIDHLLNFISVILGVSMAFYASSWSADRKDREASINMIESLVSELERDINVYERFQLEQNKTQAEILGRAIEYIQQDQLDSLPILLQRGIGFQNYAPRKVTFNSMTSSGKMSLIEDYDLQIRISTFYDALVSEALFRGESQVRFHNSHIIPLMIESTDLMNPNLDEIDLRKVSNILIMYRRMILWKIEKYQELLEAGQALQAALNAYKSSL